jgi:hypothetical protein
MTDSTVPGAASHAIRLRKLAAWRGIRVLAWHGKILYGCRGYQVVGLDAGSQVGQATEWKLVARFRPSWLRNLTSRNALSYRLMRDGFHALSIVGDKENDQTMVGAVPGALVTRTPESEEFHISHKIQRGTRPLHITAVPSGKIYWGEYFDNRDRKEAHIYISDDRGRDWQIAYTFPAGSIRHVHDIIYDRWGDCLWILTGDDGGECRILRADCDLRSIEVILAGNQQARAVAGIPTQNGFYFSTDTPLEKNHVYRLDRAGNVKRIGDLASSSIFGCRVNCKVVCKLGSDVEEALFFSTMVEPSTVNTCREVQVVASKGGTDWQILARWEKDSFSMRYFQYGNAFLPDGENSTSYLAATTIAVKGADLVTTLWEVES